MGQQAFAFSNFRYAFRNCFRSGHLKRPAECYNASFAFDLRTKTSISLQHLNHMEMYIKRKTAHSDGNSFLFVVEGILRAYNEDIGGSPDDVRVLLYTW